LTQYVAVRALDGAQHIVFVKGVVHQNQDLTSGSAFLFFHQPAFDTLHNLAQLSSANNAEL
jgi:hypothetical protein